MMTTQRAASSWVRLVPIAMMAILAGCGTTSEPAAPSASPTVADAPVETTAAPDGPSDDGAPEAPTDAAASVGIDTEDVCTNLEDRLVVEALGAASVKATEIPSGCLWKAPDGQSLAVGIVRSPGETGDPATDCDSRSARYTDVEPTQIVGNPGFSGVDEGATDYTVVVCLPDSYLTVNAGDLSRVELQFLAGSFLNAGG